MHQKIRPLIILLVIAAAVGGGYWYFSQNPEQMARFQAQLGLVDEAGGSQIVSGFIEADEVSVAAETSGRIAWLAVDEGDYVEAGQPIAQLDMAVLEAQIKQAQARVAAARAALDKVRAGLPEEEIAKAEAAVAVAEAQVEAASTAWQDAIALRDNPQELDMQIDAARTALELANLRIQQLIPFKDIGEARYELGKQQVDIVEKGFDFHIIVPDSPGDFSIPENVDIKEDLTGIKPGEDIRAHYNFKEGEKQFAWMNWNLAGTELWSAWVDLNSAIAARQDAEASLNALLRLKYDPQAADIQVAQAEAAYQTALAELEVARANLARAKAGARAEQIAVAEAQVKQAEAALAALEVQRDKHILTAPVSGWVVERVVSEGEMASPGAPLLTLADLSSVTLTVYVPEPDIGTVSLGQSIEVYVDAFPGQPFPGRVVYISDKAEFTPKNVQTKEERINTVFAVKIRLENEELKLKPGMPADAVLSAGPGL